MTALKRCFLFFLMLISWALAVFTVASWLRADMELGQAQKTSRIAMRTVHSADTTVLRAEFDMNYSKWRYHRGNIRLLLSAPDGVPLRHIIDSRGIRLCAGRTTEKIQLENVQEPYHSMRDSAANSSNCLLLSSGLSYGQGKNAVSLSFAPPLKEYPGLTGTLFFQDGELTTIVTVKGVLALFFLAWAILLTLLFFHSERGRTGTLHRFFCHLFWLIPIEIFLTALALGFWKAWLYDLRTESFLGVTISKVTRNAPEIMLQTFFLELNILLFLLLLAAGFLFCLFRRFRRGKRASN